MRYVDISVLVSYLTPEPQSQTAETFMLSAGGMLAISSWTEVELYSALGIKLRTGQLSHTQIKAALDSYQRRVAPHLYTIGAGEARPHGIAELPDGLALINDGRLKMGNGFDQALLHRPCMGTIACLN